MNHDVFISYSKDDSEVANKICKAFDANKISYRIDKEGVTGDESSAERIARAIKKSKITVFISSESSNKSVNAAKEIAIAFNNGKHILPFRIQDSPFSDKLEPYLSDLVCIDAYDNLDEKITELVNSVLKIRGDKNPIKKLLNSVLKMFGKNKSLDIETNHPNENKTDIKEFTPKVDGNNLEMVAVEGGTFWMGAQNNDKNGQNYDEDALEWELPVHQVTLSDYSIGKYPVTQELWQSVMGSNPSFFKGNKNPVECVSWSDCQEFIGKLNQLTGKKFRLPTEAEWEFAARGGNKSKGYKYSGSNSIDDVVWYDGNSNETTHPVGEKSPNELGVFDMNGNVCEWCQDLFNIYESDSQTNPAGAVLGAGRVLRGGSWNFRASYNRVSFRNFGPPNTSNGAYGFRLVEKSERKQQAEEAEIERLKKESEEKSQEQEDQDENTPKIGSIYTFDDGSKGIVFYSDSDGHGLAVSLDEAKKKWENVDNWQECHNISNIPNEKVYNTNLEVGLGATYTTYIIDQLGKGQAPAAEWCRSKGSEWYMPSAGELWQLLCVANGKNGSSGAINTALKNNGGMELIGWSYWSSSGCGDDQSMLAGLSECCGSYLAWNLCAAGYTGIAIKKVVESVRAVRAF